MSKAAERALNVLIFIGKSEHHPTMSNICEELDIPKASASDLLHTLMDAGFVRLADADRKTFALGEQILLLGNAYRQQNGYLDLIHEEARALSKEIGKTVFFWIHQQGSMVLMDRVISRTGIYPNVETGTVEPMDGRIGGVYRSGAGARGLMPDGMLSCFAEPVFDVKHRCAGVLSTYELMSRLTEPEETQIRAALARCGEQIAGKIELELS